jgi:P27 family predicted phage terminase small subunit
MRGRKPKPPELRVLHGQAKQRALAEAPRARKGLPRCPKHLTGVERETWKRLAGELHDAGVLAVIDRDALALYCVVYARWLDAEERLRKIGAVISTTNGNLIQNPYLGIANRAAEQMVRLESEFGMTPASRSRVKAEPAQPARERTRTATGDDFDPRELLGGAK